jgi:hypothetical protein
VRTAAEKLNRRNARFFSCGCGLRFADSHAGQEYSSPIVAKIMKAAFYRDPQPQPRELTGHLVKHGSCTVRMAGPASQFRPSEFDAHCSSRPASSSAVVSSRRCYTSWRISGEIWMKDPCESIHKCWASSAC